jgi:hypothetical protein
MNAVIIYEESDSAGTANALLQRASDHLGAATQWSVKPWRLDALKEPAFGLAALQDAADAHLIVLAVRRPTHTPSWLLTWLEVWAKRRHVQDAALAVFEGTGGDTLSTVVTTELSELAQRHGLSFICGDVSPAQDESAAFRADLHEREMAQTSTLTRLLEQAAPGNYQHWGINE